MIKRILVSAALLLTALLLPSVSAWAATPYPAPPVTSNLSIQVLPTSSAIGADPSRSPVQTVASGAPSSQQIQVLATTRGASGDGLAYTGVSFNVTMAVVVGGAVVLIGFMLVAFGALSLRRRRQH